MTRIQRRRHRCAEIDIPQPHHQIAGVEDRFVNVVHVRQIVNAADKLEVARTPGRVPAHGGHVLVDGLLAGRIVPGERQPDDARRHLQRVLLADALPQSRDRFQQRCQVERLRLIVNLQGANARRQIDHAVQRTRLQSLHQGVGAKTQNQIQLRIAHLQQQMGVTGESRHQTFIALALLEHHRRGDLRRPPVQILRMQTADLSLLCLRQASGGGDVNGHKAHFIARFQLPDRVQVGLNDGDRTDKPPQAWAIRAEDHRHIAGKIHRANGIGVVVNVRRMQPRLATAVAHPLGFRADQTHAGAAGVEMHFPVGSQEGLHIFRGEILRRAVRAVDHPQFADGVQGSAQGLGQRLLRAWRG